jgi:hypothetical protein
MVRGLVSGLWRAVEGLSSRSAVNPALLQLYCTGQSVILYVFARLLQLYRPLHVDCGTRRKFVHAADIWCY